MASYPDLTSANAMTKLEAFFGLRPDVQQRIGAVVTLWAMVEMQIELVLWTIEGEKFSGGRPSTDGVEIGKLIQRLNACAGLLNDSNVGRLAQTAAETAKI
jgi:hypothetical protein